MSTEPQQDGQSEQGRAGGVRIESDIWVRVIGRDGELIRRTGNISASGFFFEVEDWPGRPGDIVVMEVSSEDQAHSFTTMAKVVRVMNADQARWSTTAQGVSYEFLPSDEATRTAIARTVRHIAEQHPEQAGELELDDFQRAATEGAYQKDSENARPYIEAGAQVRLVITAGTGGSTREVTGVVGDITESAQTDGATRFWVPVYLVEDSQNSEVEPATEDNPVESAVSTEWLEASSGAESLIDSMWKDLVPEARSILEATQSGASSAGMSHLSGNLSQISMPSALWLLDQERLSGELEFRRDGEQVVLFLSEGRVIDAESPNSERDPREHLSALMKWQDGEFEFRTEDVDRPDRLGVPTQGLLLDLAVASDEAGR